MDVAELRSRLSDIPDDWVVLIRHGDDWYDIIPDIAANGEPILLTTGLIASGPSLVDE